MVWFRSMSRREQIGSGPLRCQRHQIFHQWRLEILQIIRVIVIPARLPRTAWVTVCSRNPKFYMYTTITMEITTSLFRRILLIMTIIVAVTDFVIFFVLKSRGTDLNTLTRKFILEVVIITLIPIAINLRFHMIVRKK
jgi:hypothetical protein